MTRVPAAFSPRPGRRVLAGLALAACLAVGLVRPAAAQGAVVPPGNWFDPTQLPRFTGVVDRYLPSPAGGSESLLLREGPQMLFPAEVAPELRQAAGPGQRITVWGIRARGAPVITVLAWSPGDGETPRIIERPRFFWATARGPEARPMRVEGQVKTRLYNARGDVIGAVLEDGTVVQAGNQDVANQAARFEPGATLAAAGFGLEGTEGRALSAEAVAENLAALPPEAPAPAPAR